MSKIGLTGYYGMGNYGDDLFASVGAAGAAAYWPQLSARVIGPRGIGAKAKYGLFSFIPVGIYQGVGTAGKVARLGLLASNALAVDRMAFMGGSLFHSSSSKITNLIFHKNRSRPQLSAIGVSIGPFSSRETERKVGEMLKRFEYISVRDKASLELAESYSLERRVHYGADVALSYNRLNAGPPLRENSSAATSVIGFSPCEMPDRPSLAKEYCDAFVRDVKQARLQRDIEVCVIGLNEHGRLGDERICRYVEAQLRACEIPCQSVRYRDLGIRGAWNLIASLAAYVTVRLHGAVTAFANGTPFYLCSYHRKCSDFLDEIHHPLQHAELSSPEDGEGVVSRLLTGRAVIPPAVLNECMERSAGNFLAAPWLTMGANNG